MLIMSLFTIRVDLQYKVKYYVWEWVGVGIIGKLVKFKSNSKITKLALCLLKEKKQTEQKEN